MQIAIVGFGITGAALAVLLSRRGLNVHLFEQAPDVGPVGAGILLQPAGQQVLTAMGLLDAALQQAERITEVRVRTHRGHSLVRIRYDEWQAEQCAYGLHRGRLFAALRQALDERVQVHLNTRIEYCKQHGDTALLLDAQGNEHGPFTWVFGCDGGNSTLRRNSQLPSHEYRYPCGALWHIGHTKRVRGHLFQATKGTQRLCGLLPTGDGECSFFWGATAPEAAAIRADFAGWKQQALQLFPESEDILQALQTPEELIFTTWRHLSLPRVINGRMLLLGDAAFASSPHLGQGVNLGLLDAWAYDQALAQTKDWHKAAELYAQLRHSQRRFYANLTYLLSPFFQSTIKGWGTLRDIGLPLLCATPPFRKQMVSVLTGLRKNWWGGNMKVSSSEFRVSSE
ncbi:MAG TPA: NAD(P)/FAD-dependent oxidoreductase [Blastocatellia bacterium]|nr:NAD(P)/FAD-dependent oxidoreductase [Blastocatellia bacterium]